MSVSLYANLMFVVVELVMAIVTGSQAVLLDGVYDGIEFVMLLPSIFLIPLLYKPSNEKYPFGHMQMETVFIVVKGITMITVTVGLITNSINILFHGGRTVDFGVVAWFELFACVLGIIVTFYLKRKNKAMNSPLITVEMQGWKMDSMLSLGMTAVFFLPVFLPFKGVGQLTPYLDPFITIVLSMIMLPIPVKTVFTGIRDLLLISPEEETVSDPAGHKSIIDHRRLSVEGKAGVRFLMADAVESPHKIQMPGSAAELAVSNNMVSGRFLLRHQFGNALILHSFELIGGNGSCFIIGAGLFQFCRTKKAAHVVVTERCV